MDKEKIAQIFSEIARILELKQENPFRVRAYAKAAQSLNDLSEDIAILAQQDRLREIPGIGRDLADKIKELVASNNLEFYEDLKKTIPAGLLDLVNIPTLGPKTVWYLYQKAGITSIASLEKAIAQNKLSGLPKIKQKTIENIKQGIALIKRGKERLPLAGALRMADDFMRPLSELAFVANISPAGSLRRQKESVKDIDILIVSKRPKKVIEEFIRLPLVEKILAKGDTKSSVLTRPGIQVDCRVVPEESFGAALFYFTGSKNFNIKIRALGIRMGFKINEYGIFRKEKYLAGRSEEEIFKLLKMSYIPPELREDNGEVELAQEHKLPELVEQGHILADLHAHSDYSDGENSIAEMAQAARKKGYAYIAITDHSQALKIARGLGIAELKKKRKEIERINRRLTDFRVLYGTEAEIDSEGRIDYPDKVLAEFDLVIGAIHSGFKQSKAQLTRRIVRACANPYVQIIAHPSGRLWGARDAYELDFAQVLKACRQSNTALEINAMEQRLDLNDSGARQARASGVRLAIGTDAHSIAGLQAMSLGVSVARRAWLQKKDILNCLPVEQLLKTIKK